MKYFFIISCCFFSITNSSFAQTYTQDNVIETTYISTIQDNTPVTGIFIRKGFTDTNGVLGKDIISNAEYSVKNGIFDGEYTETKIILLTNYTSEYPEDSMEPEKTTIIEQGTFFKGKKVGPTTEIRKTDHSEFTYINNVKNGPFTILYSEPLDETHTGIFVDNKIEGTLLRYVYVEQEGIEPTLELFGKVTYVNGKATGPFILYNVTNGTNYITGTLHEEIPQGEVLYYSPTGTLVAKVLFNDDGIIENITCGDTAISSYHYEAYEFNFFNPEPMDRICEEGTFAG